MLIERQIRAHASTSGRRQRLDDLLDFFRRPADGIAGGIDQAGGDEDDQVALEVLIDARAEETADERDVAEERHLVFDLLHVFTHQAAEHDRLTVEDADARRDLAGAEDRLVDDVRRDDVGRPSRPERVRRGGLNRAAVVDEAFELDDLRDEVQVDGVAIRADDRLDLESHTGVARLKRRRGRRSDRE